MIFRIGKLSIGFRWGKPSGSNASIRKAAQNLMLEESLKYTDKEFVYMDLKYNGLPKKKGMVWYGTMCINKNR